MSTPQAAHIAVSLAAHTNAGKTTLARTLLGRDVGIIDDAEHTTQVADSYTWIESNQGDTLLLWDTPGFGDSNRLLKRLEQSEHALGRFLSTTWDRMTDRGFYFSQRVLRNVRDEADCVLYLINCAEDPQLAGYLDVEMQLLRWIGKPVIVILNQYGDALDDALLEAERIRWRSLIKSDYPWVGAVLELDAFSRCWIQESHLLEALATALPSNAAAIDRLNERWITEQYQRFNQSMSVLASALLGTVSDQEPVGRSGTAGSNILGRTKEGAAQRALQARLQQRLNNARDALLELYDIDATEFQELTTQMVTLLQPGRGLDPQRSSIISGMVSGILGGLGADLATGGLSLGGGMLAGAVVGATAGRLASAGINRIRGTREPSLEWSLPSVESALPALMLLYLAVAHCGRGAGPAPLLADSPRWQQHVDAILASQPAADLPLLTWRVRLRENSDLGDAAADAFRPLLAERMFALLTSLHSPPQPMQQAFSDLIIKSAQSVDRGVES